MHIVSFWQSFKFMSVFSPLVNWSNLQGSASPRCAGASLGWWGTGDIMCVPHACDPLGTVFRLSISPSQLKVRRSSRRVARMGLWVETVLGLMGSAGSSPQRPGGLVAPQRVTLRKR